MALCSYDNELNQKYNIYKEINMTPAQKKAQAAKEVEEKRLAEEAQAAKEVEVTDTVGEDMNILEAFELAEKDGKVSRRGWSKELKNHYVFTPRGQTIQQLSNGKHSSPFTPSREDVVNKDWFNFEEEGA